VADPIPYISLPDEWANKAHCPVCNTSLLAVVHRAGAADEMACPCCHSLFEIEQRGSHIHFTALPGILAGLIGEGWVTYAEVKQAVQAVAARKSAENKAAASPPAQKAPAAPEPCPFTEEMVETFVPGAQAQVQVEQKPEPVMIPPIQSEPVYQARAPEIKDVHTRAKDLYALGNRPDQIKEILSRDPILDKTEIQAEVDALSGKDNAKKHRQRNILWVSIAIELFIIFFCGVIISVWQPLLGVVGGASGKNFVATISANETVAPLIATPMLIRQTEGPAPRPSCPKSKEQAAGLFGGSSDNWYADVSDGSWFLVTTKPVSVYVPGGMSVVVVNIGGAGVNTVPGPVIVTNIKSVTILCR